MDATSVETTRTLAPGSSANGAGDSEQASRNLAFERTGWRRCTSAVAPAPSRKSLVLACALFLLTLHPCLSKTDVFRLALQLQDIQPEPLRSARR